MSKHLKNKSVDSLKAAEYLQNQSFHHSSVHCSYYSCVQLAKYILIKKLGKSEEVRKNRTSFHSFYIREFYNSLKSKDEHLKASEFQKNITSLKKLREESDYESIEIFKSSSTRAQSISKKIQEILNSTFLP